MSSLLKRFVDALVHPTARLQLGFPLTGAKLGKSYVISILCFYGGSFAPIVALLGYVIAAKLICIQHPAAQWYLLEPLLDREAHTLKFGVLVGFVVSSFVCGFVCEFAYISRVLRRTGHTLLGVVGLKLDSIRKESKLATAWAIVWRAAVGFAIINVASYLFSLFVTIPEQPTVAFAKQLSGNQMVWFLVMAAVLAPLFEEVFFRGFLFQAIRETFHNWRLEALANCDAPGLASKFRRMLGRSVFASSSGVDVGAVVLSSAAFSMEHLQFQPVTMLMLFFMGVILAELFRRTGTLWTGILLHAANNTIATIAIIYSM